MSSIIGLERVKGSKKGFKMDFIRLLGSLVWVGWYDMGILGHLNGLFLLFFGFWLVLALGWSVGGFVSAWSGTGWVW